MCIPNGMQTMELHGHMNKDKVGITVILSAVRWDRRYAFVK